MGLCFPGHGQLSRFSRELIWLVSSAAHHFADMIVLGLEPGYPVGVEDVLPKLFDVEIFHLQPLLLLLLYDGFGLFGGRNVFLHEEPGKKNQKIDIFFCLLHVSIEIKTYLGK